MTGVGAWSDAYSKAVGFVKQLTIEEKVGLSFRILVLVYCA